MHWKCSKPYSENLKNLYEALPLKWYPTVNWCVCLGKTQLSELVIAQPEFIVSAQQRLQSMFETY